MNILHLEQAVKKIGTIAPPSMRYTGMDEHIFFSIIKENKLEIKSEEYIDAAYFHCYLLKALGELRNKNENLADWYLSKIDLNNLKVSNQMKDDIGIIYFPLISYKAYINGNYTEALNDLNHSIALIDSKITISANAIQFLKAKVEQVTNIFRIHLASKNINEAIDMATDVLKYLHYQEQSPLFYHAVNLCLETKEHKTDWLELVDLYTDTIMKKLLVHIQNQGVDEYALFKSLTTKIYDNKHSNEPEDSIRLLHEYYNGNVGLFLKSFLNLSSSSFTALPFSMQYIIASKILKLYQKNSGIGVSLHWDNFLAQNDTSGFSIGLT
ncbi:MAG: hypothetical protein WC756_13690 [Taibaiella sp.]|jgi:hypothetical protein